MRNTSIARAVLLLSFILVLSFFMEVAADCQVVVFDSANPNFNVSSLIALFGLNSSRPLATGNVPKIALDYQLNAIRMVENVTMMAGAVFLKQQAFLILILIIY